MADTVRGDNRGPGAPVSPAGSRWFGRDAVDRRSPWRWPMAEGDGRPEGGVYWKRWGKMSINGLWKDEGRVLVKWSHLFLSLQVLQLISSMYTIIKGTMWGQQGSGSSCLEYLQGSQPGWTKNCCFSLRECSNRALERCFTWGYGSSGWVTAWWAWEEEWKALTGRGGAANHPSHSAAHTQTEGERRYILQTSCPLCRSQPPCASAVPGKMVEMLSFQRGLPRIQGDTFKYLPDSTCDSAISPSSGASGPGTTNGPWTRYTLYEQCSVYTPIFMECSPCKDGAGRLWTWLTQSRMSHRWQPDPEWRRAAPVVAERHSLWRRTVCTHQTKQSTQKTK